MKNKLASQGVIKIKGNFSISSGKLDDDIANFLKKYGKK